MARISRSPGLAALLALLVAAAGCASQAVAPPVPKPSGAYRVGPPDELLVIVLPEPQISRQTVVRPDGMISVDLVGDVQAAGRTVEEIAAEIRKRIASYIRGPQVTVSLVASRSRTVTILGEVLRPATVPLSKETRVAEALGLVSGPTLLAAKSRIKVVRSDGATTNVYRVNLDAIEDGDLGTNLMLAGGDVIVVPPTVSASIGYFIRGLFFPLQMLLGVGGPATRTVITGGI
jgi:polysaccharide export outer membrane protein